MKFWKVLRWITSVLLLLIVFVSLAVNYHGGSGDDPMETSAPKFH